MAPSFQLVCFAESHGLCDEVSFKTYDHSYWYYFQKLSIHPPALMRDLSNSLGVRFLGSRPHRWFTTSPRLCLLASVSLACSVDTPLLLCRVLIGVRCFELLRWKRLEKQHLIIIPYKARRGSRDWLLSYCSSHRSLLIAPHFAADTGKLSHLHLNATSQSIFLNWIIQLFKPPVTYLPLALWFSNTLQVSKFFLPIGYKSCGILDVPFTIKYSQLRSQWSGLWEPCWPKFKLTFLFSHWKVGLSNSPILSVSLGVAVWTTWRPRVWKHFGKHQALPCVNRTTVNCSLVPPSYNCKINKPGLPPIGWKYELHPTSCKSKGSKHQYFQLQTILIFAMPLHAIIYLIFTFL